VSETILVCSNYAWTLVNFRLALLRALVAAGYQVHVLTQFDGTESKLGSIGVELHDLNIDRKGINPLRDVLTLFCTLRVLRKVRPLVVLNFTIKPVIYGGMAARMLGVRCISTITGLGTAFVRDNWLTGLVRQLYRVSQRRVARVFFQNHEDMALFESGRLVPAGRMVRLPGSGVDLAHFQVQPLPDAAEVRMLLIARLLWDKGVGEYVEATRRLRRVYPQCRFQLLGPLGVENRTAIDSKQMDAWVAEGVVEYLGTTDDVRPFIAGAHCVVLPSYREGVPRALLEAAAMGRPLIAADSVGCRDVVEDGVNGYLCRVRDPVDLSRKMEQFMELPAEKWQAMGQAGRTKVEREFDERIVVGRYLELVGELAGNSGV
jgi:glycosyltransferase involved in cell wall biosynthesis